MCLIGCCGFSILHLLKRFALVCSRFERGREDEQEKQDSNAFQGFYGAASRLRASL